jgi:hypothetical protein
MAQPLAHDAQVHDPRIHLALACKADIALELWHKQRESFHVFSPGRALRPAGFVRFVADGFTYAPCTEPADPTQDEVDRQRQEPPVRALRRAKRSISRSSAAGASLAWLPARRAFASISSPSQSVGACLWVWYDTRIVRFICASNRAAD